MKLTSVIIVVHLFVLTSADEPAVKIKFFGNGLADSVTFTYAQPIISDFAGLPQTYHTNSKKTALYIHGWLESADDPGPVTVTQAYLTRKSEFNVAVVEWSAVSKNLAVLTVLSQLTSVSRVTTWMIRQMIEGGLDESKLHIVGFCLGAIVAGNVGRSLDDEALKVSRITGLDPASVMGMTALYFPLDLPCLLKRTDAQLVDIVHTNAAGIGDGTSCGHVDFWPNGGGEQPNCAPVTGDLLNDLVDIESYTAASCSHRKAWQYYAESVAKPSTLLASLPFLANQCNQTVTGSQLCSPQATASMGFFASKTTTNRNSNLTVNYSLGVNAKAPFSMS